ncbi:histone H4 transcription factor [Maniola hyperantus]|uniref:histone H4 transcription factor n=1 Tax=Aphantopus hyperantus TaxID=2795564 RepID=UPI00156946B0|nr:histone H4 transcription factor [Maniola hyperantus]
MEDSLLEVVENPIETAPKVKLKRCLEWLQSQNELKKVSSDNHEDIQYITDNNVSRKDSSVSDVDDDTTVPAGVDERPIEPKAVPVRHLRVKSLDMQCEWQSCRSYFSDYEIFQKHVAEHSSELHVIDVRGNVDYVCLWDVCGHSTSDFSEIMRHINYHAYHARLLAIGFNGRASLKLQQCRKDSSKRNQLSPLKHKHCCMWVGCSQSYNSIQTFFDHVKQHIKYSDKHLCSWAGCGAVFPRRPLLTMHVRSHTQERLIACYHCGQHFTCNRKLSDHLMRQNVDAETGIPCDMCGILCASPYLKREHERQHISAYACAMCDMSAPSPAALAYHMRYRHLSSSGTRTHACPHCSYKAVTKSDLRKHIPIHFRKKKRKKTESDVQVISDDDSSEEIVKKKKKVVKKKYACHMCPEKEVKVFSRGTRLTTHLVKVHGAQWSCGHSRFRYQISEDGMYRLTTTRFEYEDISKKIVDGYSGPKESLNNTLEFDVKPIAEATKTTPKRFEISLKNSNLKENEQKSGDVKSSVDENAVEIMMCDVDDDGNIISTKTIQSYQLLI